MITPGPYVNRLTPRLRVEVLGDCCFRQSARAIKWPTVLYRDLQDGKLYNRRPQDFSTLFVAVEGEHKHD